MVENLQILLKTGGNSDRLEQCATFTMDYPDPKHGAMYYLHEGGACKAPVSDFAKLKLGFCVHETGCFYTVPMSKPHSNTRLDKTTVYDY